jgi:hypothetical protein
MFLQYFVFILLGEFLEIQKDTITQFTEPPACSKEWAI